MRKSILSAIIIAAFFAGTFLTAFSIADATDGGNNAWAKLVARVTALEEKPANNMLFKQLHDDAEGHAKGWIPDPIGGTSFFIITDSDVTNESMVTTTVAGHDGFNLVDCPADVFDGGFTVSCFITPVIDGSILNYTIINPPS